MGGNLGTGNGTMGTNSTLGQLNVGGGQAQEDDVDLMELFVDWA